MYVSAILIVIISSSGIEQVERECYECMVNMKKMAFINIFVIDGVKRTVVKTTVFLVCTLSIMRCSVGYIIKRGILVALNTYNKFIEDVHNIPFIGKDGRQSPSYYLDIQLVLQHLICNNSLYAKETPVDHPWIKYSPI